MKTVESRDDIVQEMRAKGFCVVAPAALSACFGVTAAALSTLDATWNDLPRDCYLKDGGKYRARRHSSFVQTMTPPAVTLSLHRAHWQPVDYNALHGGIERWFEPISPLVCEDAAWRTLLRELGNVFAAAVPSPRGEGLGTGTWLNNDGSNSSHPLPNPPPQGNGAKPVGAGAKRWFIEAHQFRIDTSNGIGRPTPEGAHRDGVDFVAVVLVNRQHIKGGETRVFEAHGPSGVRFTLTEPWSVLLLDDARVIHESTPIQPDGTAPEGGARDTLVLTYRAHSFQDPV